MARCVHTEKPYFIQPNIFSLLLFASLSFHLKPEYWHLKFGFSPSSVFRNLKSCQTWDYGWLLQNQFYLCVLNAIQSACVLKHLKMSASHKMRGAEVKMGLCLPSSSLVRTGNKLSNANDPQCPVRWTLRCIGGLAVIFYSSLYMDLLWQPCPEKWENREHETWFQYAIVCMRQLKLKHNRLAGKAVMYADLVRWKESLTMNVVFWVYELKTEQ